MTNDFSNHSHVALITGSRDWSDEPAMIGAFRRMWDRWDPATVVDPLLIVGDCPTGADAMAARLWTKLGLDVRVIAADWKAHGRAGGPFRNQEMVDLAVRAADAGIRVAAGAFLDLCTRPDCRRAGDEQLRSTTGIGGHYSHGTADARARIVAAGLPLIDVFAPRLPPF